MKAAKPETFFLSESTNDRWHAVQPLSPWFRSYSLLKCHVSCDMHFVYSPPANRDGRPGSKLRTLSSPLNHGNFPHVYTLGPGVPLYQTRLFIVRRRGKYFRYPAISDQPIPPLIFPTTPRSLLNSLYQNSNSSGRLVLCLQEVIATSFLIQSHLLRLGGGNREMCLDKICL